MLKVNEIKQQHQALIQTAKKFASEGKIIKIGPLINSTMKSNPRLKKIDPKLFIVADRGILLNEKEILKKIDNPSGLHFFKVL